MVPPARRSPPTLIAGRRGKGVRCQQPVAEFIAVVEPGVPAAPIDVLEPGVVELAPGVVEPVIPPAPPDKDPFALVLPVVPALEPSVLVEPARSRAPLPVESDEPIAVPVPVVPDRLPFGLPAAPIADVVPGVPATPGEWTHGVVEPGLMGELGLVLESGLVVEPDEVWASASPPAVANAEAVTSMANVFLLAFMFKTPWCG